jgi:hypothetical protein
VVFHLAKHGKIVSSSLIFCGFKQELISSRPHLPPDYCIALDNYLSNQLPLKAIKPTLLMGVKHLISLWS